MLDLAALDDIDFGTPRRGPISPGTCPACAMINQLLIECAKVRDPQLAVMTMDLGMQHGLKGHPSDSRWP